MTVETKI